MREAQKVERLRLSFSSLLPVLFGVPPKLNPARLVWVEFQSKRLQPLPEVLKEAVCVRRVLEPEDRIVRIADDDHRAKRLLLTPGVHPEVKHVVQV